MLTDRPRRESVEMFPYGSVQCRLHLLEGEFVSKMMKSLRLFSSSDTYQQDGLSLSLT